MDKNRILSGTNGNVWVDGALLGQLQKIEAKVTGNFEEVNFVGDFATYPAYTGWSGEGTLVLHKIDSTVLKLVADGFKTGNIPTIKITTKLTDRNTGKSERVAIGGVVFTEFMLANMEAKGLIQEELPFKFSDYDVIERI